MFATSLRYSATIARQPVKNVASRSAAAGLKTSASSRAIIAPAFRDFVVNEEGRVCSLTRRQHVYDAQSYSNKIQKEKDWSNIAARNRDAKILAGF